MGNDCRKEFPAGSCHTRFTLHLTFHILHQQYPHPIHCCPTKPLDPEAWAYRHAWSGTGQHTLLLPTHSLLVGRRPTTRGCKLDRGLTGHICARHVYPVADESHDATQSPHPTPASCAVRTGPHASTRIPPRSLRVRGLPDPREPAEAQTAGTGAVAALGPRHLSRSPPGTLLRPGKPPSLLSPPRRIVPGCRISHPRLPPSTPRGGRPCPVGMTPVAYTTRICSTHLPTTMLRTCTLLAQLRQRTARYCRTICLPFPVPRDHREWSSRSPLDGRSLSSSPRSRSGRLVCRPTAVHRQKRLR